MCAGGVGVGRVDVWRGSGSRGWMGAGGVGVGGGCVQREWE